ncbi:MAG: ATP-binding cassette domain-containing protein [Isosphaeraceae bacterium]|nr:ATP-binding cassette domain-containing protein [Isosphaeraceae bacterium]
MTVLVRFAGVGKQYPSGSAVGLTGRLRGNRNDRPWALAPLDLEVVSGESVAILGRNGSGKSTLLGLAAGTIAPTAGRVDRRVDPTLLFTVGTSFDEELSGAENARVELLLRGLRGRSLQLCLAEAREFSGIEDAWEEPLRTYSTGMRMRVAMAAALADPGPLLLVDEILAVGDAAFVATCLDHFRTLRKSGASLLFVTHSVDLAASLADESIILDHSLVVARGSIADGLATYAAMIGVPPPPNAAPNVPAG